jgi:hypothetical protein
MVRRAVVPGSYYVEEVVEPSNLTYIYTGSRCIQKGLAAVPPVAVNSSLYNNPASITIHTYYESDLQTRLYIYTNGVWSASKKFQSPSNSRLSSTRALRL